MQNRKKLYRSLAGIALMLFAGLVLAPNLISSGFHASGKKSVATGPQLAQGLQVQTSLKEAQTTLKNVPHQLHDTPARPAPINAPNTQPADATPPPQSGESRQPEGNGPTTFVLNEFMPNHPSFPHGAASSAGIDIASSGVHGDVAKIIHMPKSPVTDNGNKPSDNNGTSHNNSDGHPNTANTPEHENHDTPGDDRKPTGDSLPLPSIAGDNPGERPVVSVPEPSSILLLMAGLVGLVIARRRG